MALHNDTRRTTRVTFGNEDKSRDFIELCGVVVVCDANAKGVVVFLICDARVEREIQDLSQ